MAGGARLRGVSVKLERRAGDRSLDEAWNHHPVLARLARSDRVEEARDDAVEPAFLVEAEREKLVHRLRVGVEPASFSDGPVDATIALRQWTLLAMVSVYHGARRDQNPL